MPPNWSCYSMAIFIEMFTIYIHGSSKRARHRVFHVSLKFDFSSAECGLHWPFCIPRTLKRKLQKIQGYFEFSTGTPWSVCLTFLLTSVFLSAHNIIRSLRRTSNILKIYSEFRALIAEIFDYATSTSLSTSLKGCTLRLLRRLPSLHRRHLNLSIWKLSTPNKTTKQSVVWTTVAFRSFNSKYKYVISFIQDCRYLLRHGSSILRLILSKIIAPYYSTMSVNYVWVSCKFKVQSGVVITRSIFSQTVTKHTP